MFLLSDRLKHNRKRIYINASEILGLSVFQIVSTCMIMGEVEHGRVSSSPMRVFFSPDDLVSFDKEKFLQHWYKQEEYINLIESKLLSPQTGQYHLIILS